MPQPRQPHQDRHEDHPHEHPDEDVEPADRAGGGVLPWVLVVAAAAPVLLTAEACREFFAGDLDGQYFGYYGAGGDLVPALEVSLLDRWNAFGYAVPALPALLASALGVAVVTGLVLLDRPRRLVPGTAARWAACGVAVATAAAAGLLLLLVLLVVSEDVDTNAQGGVTPVPTFTSVVGPVGVALLTGVLTGLAATVLARPPVRPGAVPVPPAPLPPPTTGVAPGEPPAGAPVPPRSAEPPSPSPSPAPAPQELPRPADDDLELYRRR